MQHTAGMGSSKTSRPDNMMGRMGNKFPWTGERGIRRTPSTQKGVLKRMAAKKRRQRDKGL